MSIVQYLESKGIIEIKELTSGEVIMSPCPWCGKESDAKKHHFYVNLTGVCHCKVCKNGGNIWQLKKKFGDFKDWNNNDTGERLDEKIFRDKTGRIIGRMQNKSQKSKKSTMVIGYDIMETANQFLFSDNEKAKGALQYLKEVRGFTEDIINHFKIGLVVRGKCKNENQAKTNNKCEFYGIPKDKRCPKCGSKFFGFKWFISMPYFNSNGNLTNVKYRLLPPEKEFQREKGGISSLFNIQNIEKKPKKIIITESETDAMAIYQMGFKNVVSSSIGAGGWQKEWNRYFVDTEEIYFAFDIDDAGDDGAIKTAQILGAFRCFRMEFPEGINDANDFLAAGGTKKDINKIIKEAPTLGSKVLMSPIELGKLLKKRIKQGDSIKGLSSGWKELDDIIGGIRPSELILFTGDTGSGKSILSNALAMNLIKNGSGALICSFEIPVIDTFQRALQQFSNHSWEELDGNEETYDMAVDGLDSNPVYFANLHGSIDLDELIKIMRWVIVRHNISFIVLDHLHYFVPESGTKYERHAIEKTMRILKKLTLEWGIDIGVVVHPNSDLMGGGRVGLNSLKGSSEIKKEADLIFSLYRARGWEETLREQGIKNKGAAEVRIIKCRSQFGREGVVWFEFNIDTLNYTPMSKQDTEWVKWEDGQYLKKLLSGVFIDKKPSKKKEVRDGDTVIELETNNEYKQMAFNSDSPFGEEES